MITAVPTQTGLARRSAGRGIARPRDRHLELVAANPTVVALLPVTNYTPARPKLLIVITLAEIGGAQTCVAQLLPALVREYDVTVATHGDGPLRAAIHESGARSIDLAQMRRRIGPRDLAALLELVRLIRSLRPDIVHTHSSKAGILGRLAARVCGTPVVLFTAHGWAFKARRWSGCICGPTLGQADHDDRRRC